MLTKTGVPTDQDLLRVIPSQERLQKGPVAVIECFQNIPCNPCYLSCMQGAIQEFADINDLPKILDSKCNGCGICVANCPGLAIFVVDYTYSEDEAIIKIPYEYLPVPEINSQVVALNREGKEIGKGTIKRVQSIKGQERTKILWLVVAKDLAMSVRNIRLEGQGNAE